MSASLTQYLYSFVTYCYSLKYKYLVNTIESNNSSQFISDTDATDTLNHYFKKDLKKHGFVWELLEDISKA